MKRLLVIVAGSALLSLVAISILCHAMDNSGISKLRLTRVRRNIYQTSDSPTYLYYTRDCTAPAHRSKVTLWVGDTLRFPTGERCYCSSIRPWTRQEDAGVVRMASLGESR